MTRAVADTSIFIGLESGRLVVDLPEQIAISVVTAAELELGVLRARDGRTRAIRLATLTQVRSTYPLLVIDDVIATRFARIAAEELEAGRKIRRHDAWIAATALRHDAVVVTQDADFSSFASVEVVRVSCPDLEVGELNF